MATPKATFLDALASASLDDLTAIDTRVAVLEQELESLRVARKVLDVKLNGKTPRRSPSTAPRGMVALKNHRTNAALYIKSHGPTLTTVLCDKLGIRERIADNVFNHPWFQKTSQGIVLTSVGKTECG